MAHPNRREGIEGHNSKLRRYTRDYGDANPAMKKLARVDALKAEGEEDAVGFGADSSAPTARADRPARRTAAANPLAAYKRGGKVKRRADGGDVSAIEMANRNQAQSDPDRARGGRLKSKGTNVNVIIAPQAAPAGAAAPPPMPVGLTPPPPAAMPPKPPLGAGGPPPPMGGPGGPNPMLAGAPGGLPPGLIPPRARGGKVSHPDEAEDRAMIKGMVKPSALKRAHGGKVHHMTAGAATGEGRLEKIGKKGHNAGRPQTV